MRRRACTDLRGGRSVRIVPTATETQDLGDLSEIGALACSPQSEIQVRASRGESRISLRVATNSLVSRLIPKRGQSMQTFLRDVLHAARSLRRFPAFAATVVLTLALGVGATTAIFSCVYALLLQSLPFEDAGRIIALSEIHPQI